MARLLSLSGLAKQQAGLQGLLISSVRSYASHMDPNAGMSPILFQQDTHNGWAEPFVPISLGVMPMSEPGVHRPGTVHPPEPSLELQAPAPVVRVTSEMSVDAPPEADNSVPGSRAFD